MSRATDYSVVIPAFNAAATIAAAVHSVLSQSVAPRAVVIVDDGSTDATAEVVAALPGPVRLVRQANQGPGAATNAGFALCDDPLVATLDADDLWLPGKMERQLERLRADADLAAVFCRLATFQDDPARADLAGARGGWSRSTMLIRREVIAAVGPIVDPPGRAGEMVDWFARAKEQGHRFELIAEPLALRRVRPGSLTYAHPDLAGSYLQVARAALLRRRAAARKDG